MSQHMFTHWGNFNSLGEPSLVEKDDGDPKGVGDTLFQLLLLSTLLIFAHGKCFDSHRHPMR